MKTNFLRCEVPTLQPVRPGAHDPRQASWKLFWNVLDKESFRWNGCKQKRTGISWILGISWKDAKWALELALYEAMMHQLRIDRDER